MSKRKVRKKKKIADDDTHEHTLASTYIRSDHRRSQRQALASLPVDDPNSEHFDERKYDKTLYHRQSMDWMDYETASELQQKYSLNLPEEFQQHYVDAAPFDMESRNTYYAESAYKSSTSGATPHLQMTEYGGTIDTAFPMESEQSNDISSSSNSSIEDDEELSDLHPSEGGDPRKFIQNQINQQQANFQQWRTDSDDNVPPMWNNALADRFEDKDNWWNVSAKEKYDMPHQALHGGVDKFDDEADIPLNSYWHKSTVSPDSWHIMKEKYRQNMRPGSEEWNRWAFRTDVERKTLKFWPTTARTWFLRHEEELLNSHEFRCKMMEHSAMDEYWRLGELRWNRKLWEPYLRIGTWVIAPIVGAAATWWYRKAIGYRTKTQFTEEFKRWKQTCAIGEGDEHYMFSWRDSLQKRRPPPVVSPAITVDELGSKKHRTLSYHAERLMRGPAGDPY